MEYTITATHPIAGDKIEIESSGISYTNLGKYHYIECDNVENNSLIRKECAKIAKAIKIIEELNK